MTTLSTVPAKHRSRPVAWIIWAAGMTALAVGWIFRRGRQPEKALSRAEEKQRRKALVRKHRERRR